MCTGTCASRQRICSIKRDGDGEEDCDKGIEEKIESRVPCQDQTHGSGLSLSGPLYPKLSTCFEGTRLTELV